MKKERAAEHDVCSATRVYVDLAKSAAPGKAGGLPQPRSGPDDLFQRQPIANYKG